MSRSPFGLKDKGNDDSRLRFLNEADADRAGAGGIGVPVIDEPFMGAEECGAGSAQLDDGSRLRRGLAMVDMAVSYQMTLTVASG